MPIGQYWEGSQVGKLVIFKNPGDEGRVLPLAYSWLGGWKKELFSSIACLSLQESGTWVMCFFNFNNTEGSYTLIKSAK
jgi:hypothetical protein